MEEVKKENDDLVLLSNLLLIYMEKYLLNFQNKYNMNIKKIFTILLKIFIIYYLSLNKFKYINLNEQSICALVWKVLAPFLVVSFGPAWLSVAVQIRHRVGNY